MTPLDHLVEPNPYFPSVDPHDCADTPQIGIDSRYHYCVRCGMVLAAPTFSISPLPDSAPLTQGTFAATLFTPTQMPMQRFSLLCHCPVVPLRATCDALQAEAPMNIELWQGIADGEWTLHLRVVMDQSDHQVWRVPVHRFAFELADPLASERELVAFAPFNAFLAALPATVIWIGLCSVWSRPGRGIMVIGADGPIFLPVAADGVCRT